MSEMVRMSQKRNMGVVLLSILLILLIAIYGPVLVKDSPLDAIIDRSLEKQVNINFVSIERDKINIGHIGNGSLWGTRVNVVDGSVRGKIPDSGTRIYVTNGYVDYCDNKFIVLRADKVELYGYRPILEALWERTKQLLTPLLLYLSTP